MNEESGIEIPKTHSELLEFIGEHREQICSDWKLLFGIIKALDELLQITEHMCDLHKDTTIILEAVKMQQRALLKEFRSELTFEKALVLIENDSLDGFFEDVKASSQCMDFVDHLNFDYMAHKKPLRERIQYDKTSETMFVPGTLEHIDEAEETNITLQSIKDQVLFTGKIEYFRLICDEESFSKTVFNAFNVALALRMKLISLRNINSVLYVVPYEAGGQVLGHSVLEITPEYHKRIRELLTSNNKSTQP